MTIKPANKNLNEIFDLYIDECKFINRLRKETVRSSTEAFRHFKNTVPEIFTTDEVSPELITVFFKRLQERERTVGKGQIKTGIKDSTIKTYGSRLKTFFKWMKDRGYIKENPFDKITLPSPTYNDHRALKGGEIKKIMGAIAQYSKTAFMLKRDMLMVGILTFCGVRRNELVSLELRDIDHYNWFITVRGETSKSKKTRKVPINIHLRMYLLEYLEERKKQNCKSPFLFVSNGLEKPLTIHGLKHWVIRLSKLSGVKFHVHRFRHTFATNLAMQDVGVIKIQKLMGHTDIKMTSAYLRSISTENMRDDVNKLSFENIT